MSGGWRARPKCKGIDALSYPPGITPPSYAGGCAAVVCVTYVLWNPSPSPPPSNLEYLTAMATLKIPMVYFKEFPLLEKSPRPTVPYDQDENRQRGDGEKKDVTDFMFSIWLTICSGRSKHAYMHHPRFGSPRCYRLTANHREAYPLDPNQAWPPAEPCSS